MIQATTAILDGEIVALEENGLQRFDGLRSRRTNTAVVFYALELLYLDGYDLSGCPLIKRKELLRKILPKTISDECATQTTLAVVAKGGKHLEATHTKLEDVPRILLSAFTRAAS